MTRATAHRRVEAVRLALRRKIDAGALRPGQRFWSARDLADRYGIAYLTADRLLKELTDAGRLVRKPRSGTFVAGQTPARPVPQLFLPERAKVAGTFANHMRRCLRDALPGPLSDARVRFLDATDRRPSLPPQKLPVLWETPTARRACLDQQRRAVLIHDLPRPREAALFDAVAIDNHTGGYLAGQTFRNMLGPGHAEPSSVAVVAGPRQDPRSHARLRGFRDAWPDASVITAGGWTTDHGRRAASAVRRKRPRALFCANDRLAEGVLEGLAERGEPRPLIIGFDDAPIAERLQLTTIGIPWRAFADEVRDAVQRRLDQPDAPARRVELTPQLILRRLDAGVP
ncbi:MAG: substrate-binding domain-containing protein [Planctomycetota bacterium]